MAKQEANYSLVQVAALLLYAPEKFLAAHDPKTANYDAARDKYRSRYSEDDQHAYIEAMRRRNLSTKEREAIVIGLADLEAAMAKLNDYHREGIAQFCANGPGYINEKAGILECQPYQARHVRALWMAVNGMDMRG